MFVSVRKILALSGYAAVASVVCAAGSDVFDPGLQPEFDADFDGKICNSTCPRGSGTFCGTDHRCHPHSCASRYEYTRNRTGVDKGASAPLVCKDIDMTDPGSDGVFYASVSYRCRALRPPPVRMGFNRRCAGATAPFEGRYTQFTCYELAASTDFERFLANVENEHRTLECTGSKLNETGYPKFAYTVVYESQDKPGSTDVVLLTSLFNSTAQFDAASALGGTMYSVSTTMTTQSPTMVPTVALTTAEPSLPLSPSASGSFFNAKNGFIVFATAASVLVYWCW